MEHTKLEVLIGIGKVVSTFIMIAVALYLVFNIEEFKGSQNPCAYAEKHNFTCCDTYQVITPSGQAYTYNSNINLSSLNLTALQSN